MVGSKPLRTEQRPPKKPSSTGSSKTRSQAAFATRKLEFPVPGHILHQVLHLILSAEGSVIALVLKIRFPGKIWINLSSQCGLYFFPGHFKARLCLNFICHQNCGVLCCKKPILVNFVKSSFYTIVWKPDSQLCKSFLAQIPAPSLPEASLKGDPGLGWAVKRFLVFLSLLLSREGNGTGKGLENS